MIKSGDKVNDYDVVKKLGGGAFGQAFLVSKHNKTFVMKVIYKNLSNKDQVNTFKNEQKVLQKINRFTRCNEATTKYLCMLDSFETPQYYALITNYLPKSITLQSYINRFKNMNTNIPFENVQFIFSKLIKDLYSLHKKNIAHGDIKPENILIKADGNKVEEVMFIDYGGSCMTKLCKAGGTILYASPEVLTKLPGGPLTLDSYKKADVFSLGIVLFELLSNKLPSPRKASMPRSRSSSRRSSSVNSPQPSNLVTDLVPLVKFWTSDPFIFIPPRDYKNETWMEFMENLVEQMLEPNIQKRLSSRQVYHRFVKFDK